VLESRKTYTSKVVADMTSRTPGSVRDIPQVMAQTRAGYEAVFGGSTTRRSPSLYRARLLEHTPHATDTSVGRGESRSSRRPSHTR
jgi:hypothetical protein